MCPIETQGETGDGFDANSVCRARFGDVDLMDVQRYAMP